MRKELSRREFLALTAGVLAVPGGASVLQSPQRVYAYVGSMTAGSFGSGGGGAIHVFAVNMDDGSLTHVSQTGPEFDDLAPDYIRISPDRRFLYSVNETGTLNGRQGAGGGVLAFRVDQENGSISHLNTQPSMGANPCYVAVDATGSLIVVANHGRAGAIVRIARRNGRPEIESLYDDGTVALFSTRPDGSLEPAGDVGVLERIPGASREARTLGQVHSVNFDPSNRFVLACDVGADNLYVYRVDARSRTLTNVRIFPTPPGRAPRHSVFHPSLPYVFIVNEREPSLSSFHFDSGTGEVRPIQTVPTVPAGNSVEGIAPSEVRLHPNGKFVYGSNRGHNSIAILEIEAATGRMTPVDVVETGGSNPRGFSFEPSGRFMFVGNQQTGNIVTFRVDADSGRMTPTGATTEVSRPACVQAVAL